MQVEAHLIARGLLPRPDFKTCERCEMRSTCRDMRHCSGPSVAQVAATTPRFHMEHGMIFDRSTGVHVHTDDASDPGATQRLYTLLTELSSGGSL